MQGGRIELVGLTKAFGAFQAVRGIDLEIGSGEFFSLLGPSGCGKTTTLRMIGGFERPTSGEIRVDGEDLAQTPPEQRPVNTVFQSYALFPHLDVRANVGFGLRFTDCDKATTKTRVAEALELVRLSEFGHRRPNELSGGQQQRVALARALVLRPRVLLLDEPLGALDAKLRKALQRELTTLHREVGITFVYVTHDQEEALTMSDRLAVMRDGRIEQMGSPQAVYERPDTAYVADFLGVANLLDGHSDGAGTVRIGNWALPSEHAGTNHDTARTVPAGPCHVVVRPERVQLSTPGGGTSASRRATVADLVYLGALTQVVLETAESGVRLTAMLTNDGTRRPYGVGEEVDVDLTPEALHVIAGEAEELVLDPEAAEVEETAVDAS